MDPSSTAGTLAHEQPPPQEPASINTTDRDSKPCKCSLLNTVGVDVAAALRKGRTDLAYKRAEAVLHGTLNLRRRRIRHRQFQFAAWLYS
jgi:hypothetical protein